MNSTKQKIHPLRPTENAIVVCEGESDYRFLSAVWQGHPDYWAIDVFWAGGEKSVATLASILSPAIWIKDRDFKYSEEESRNSFRNRKRQTFWPRHDIEGYLLYVDWLLEALQKIHQSPQFHAHYLPVTSEAEADILKAARKLVLEHAGEKTYQEILRAIGQRCRGKASKRAQLGTREEWQSYLWKAVEAARINGQQLANDKSFTKKAIQERLVGHIERYEAWARDIQTTRIHFSGKRLFKMLATLWQKDNGPKYRWSVLRDETMSCAIDYSSQVSSLRDDPRLGDLGLLGDKALGK